MFSPRVQPRHDRPLVFAHRGASAHAPGNSVEALALARAAGADGVEIDVRFTRDRVMVLSHDDRLAGIGAISAVGFAELRSGAPGIATLDEVPDVIGEMMLDIEIKNHPADADFDPLHRQAADVAAWLERRGLIDRAIVSSFNPDTVGAVAQLAPEVTTGLLLEHGGGFGEHVSAAARIPHQWILPRHGALRVRGRGRVERAHGSGLLVGTWTVDHPRALRRFRSIGVDVVITNDPATARAIYG